MSIEGSFPGGVKRQGLKAYHLPPYCAEVKKDGTMFLLAQYLFMACYLIH
jgi:hypothetical protein